MRHALFTLVLVAALMAAQTGPSSPEPKASASAATPAHQQASLSPNGKAQPMDIDKPVPPNRPVITLRGLCDQPGGAGKKAGCTTVVTRRQLDTVIDNLRISGQVLAPTMRRSIAQGYTELLVYSAAAKKAGVDKDPRFQEVLRFARMRALTDMYRLHLDDEARKVSPRQIEAYYKNNIDKFEELHLHRVVLPRFNSANLSDEDYAAKAKAEAAEVRERAVGGEDLDKLQKEAYEKMGVTKPPATSMGAIRRGMYSEKEEKEIFSLKPGEVSVVIEEPSTFLIFRLDGRNTPPLADSKAEIQGTIYKERLEVLKNEISNAVHVEYDDFYLGPAPPHPGWIPVGPLPSAQGANREPAPAR